MKILFYLLFASGTMVYPQQVKSWQNHTNMKQIEDFVVNDNLVWAATNGGVFGFNENDSSFTKLTKSEGLSSHSITAIAVDEENKVWIGTREGFLDIYYPETNSINTLYDISKTNEANKKINSLQISGDTVFVATEFGLILYNSKDLSVFDSILKFGEFNTGTPVYNVLIGNPIYVVTLSGIAVSKTGFKNNLSAPEAWGQIEIPAVSSVQKLVKFDNSILAATNNGIYRINDGSYQLEFFEDDFIETISIIDESLFSVINNYNNQNELINSVLYKHGDQLQQLFSTASHSTKVSKLFSGNIILGTDLGLTILKNEESIIVFPNSPETNTILSTTVDSEGIFWSATGQDNNGIGVLKLDENNWQTLNRDLISEFKINDFHRVASSQNAVYLLTWGRGFIRYKDGIYESFDIDNTSMVGTPPGGTHLAINDVKEDSDGNAWVLNYSSVNLEPLSVLTTSDQIINFKFSAPLFPVVANFDNLVIDQFNTKWLTGDLNGDAETSGLYYFNENGTLENTSDDVWGKLEERNGLRSSDITAVAVDQFGELIVGTSFGVDVIPDPSNPSAIRGDQYFALRLQTINCLAVDPINQKWFGTEKGVFLMSSDGSSLIANYTKSNSPLPSDNIKSISIDKKSGIVYVGTDFGVTAISTFFIEPNQNFSELTVYPNPISLSTGRDELVVIDGLVEGSEIKILNISGDLINQFQSIGGKTTTWNCKDLDGKLVSSGVYIIVAFDSEVNEIGHAKLAILRQ